MNILLVPSWYPTAADPIAGIFQREQAFALISQRPQWNVAVSLVAQPAVWLTSPGSWAGVRLLGRRRTHVARVRPNLLELRSTAVVWTELAHAGNRAGVLAAHRANAERASRELGQFDLVHAHVAYPAGWFAMRLAAELGIPYVITEHMSPFPFPSLLDDAGGLRKIVCEPLARASETIAVSPALAQEIETYGLRRPTVVPNLVDEEFFTRGPARRDETCVFFTLGALREQKGIDDLLRGIACWRGDASVPATFRIAGDGERAAEYRSLARQLGVDPLIEWLGDLDRETIRREYRRCDCFILTSRHESFGVVYAEALACGKPVIATRSGGPESIVNETNGLLVDVGDIAGIARALALMAEHSRSYDAAAIRQQAVELYSRGAVVDQLEWIYRRVLGSGAARYPA